MPDVANGTMHYMRPAVMPTLEQQSSFGGVLWFLDEADKWGTSIQNSMLGAILEREVHGHGLSDNVTIVGACNPEGTRSGGAGLTSAMQNRFIVIDVELHTPSVLNYLIDRDADMRVVTYLQLRGEGTPSEPGALCNFDPRVKGAFASPRSWEETSDVLRAGYPGNILPEQIRGTIGDVQGNEFLAYLALVDEMPNPMGVLLDPLNSPVPSKPGVLYGLMGALANLASDSNFQAVIAYANRVPKPFAVFCVLTAIRKHENIKKTNAFTQWAIKNQDVLA
jgi:hypothetical protein